MREDIFGEAPDPEREPELKVLWPLRSVNVIEAELSGMMGEAVAREEWRAPMIWIEDDQWANAHEFEEFYGELTLREAMALRDIIFADAAEPFRRPLIIARECGPSAKLTDYFLACEAEGIEPILKRKTP
jgi:hypothetical protein